MQYVVRINKYFFGVMPKSRKVSFEQTDATTGEVTVTYQHVSELGWSEKTPEGHDLREHGKLVHVDFLPKDKQLKLFLVTAKHRVEYLVTNQVGIETTEDAKQVGGFRWKIEQFHREVKQLTGVARCQARKGRKQRNHICIAFVVWHQLNELAQQMKTTMYEVKHIPLREYQKQLWRSPAYKFDASLLGEFA